MTEIDSRVDHQSLNQAFLKKPFARTAGHSTC